MPSFPDRRPAGVPKLVIALAAIPLLAAAAGAYVWFVQRVEVGSDELLVLVRKVGEALPDSAGDQVVLYPELLAKLGEPPNSTRFKGIIYEPLQPGRYFYDPFFWRCERIKVTVIEQSQEKPSVGVLIRKYGDPLPPGERVAPRDKPVRGPVAGVLPPGRHSINTLAYDVKIVSPVSIEKGYCGVQTLLSGSPPKNPNLYIVGEGEAGVQAKVLPPGFNYINPYEVAIDPVEVRSHTLDFRDADVIEFPSNDGFDIVNEWSIEYAIRQDMAPYVLVAIGDHAEVVSRILLPYMRSLTRIEGSKLQARDFISGEKRTAFQNSVFEQLRDQCYSQGIEIRAALIRRIVAPREIADPISDRQIAGQEIRQYESEILVARSEAKFTEQQEMQKQNQEIGGANRAVVSTLKEAETRKNVAVLEAQRKLEVARLRLAAATEEAAAILSRGKAEAEVKRLGYAAKATPIHDAVSAFGDGETYAQFFFYQKLAPSLRTVLDSTDGPLADVFRAFAPARVPAIRGAAATGGAQ